jgi:hypothetical protein
MITATWKKDLSADFQGEAQLFKLSKKVKDGYDGKTRYVIVSAVHKEWPNSIVGTLPPLHETYIFPARKDGTVKNWSEMPGSFKGNNNVMEALENAGWKVEGYPA